MNATFNYFSTFESPEFIIVIGDASKDLSKTSEDLNVHQGISSKHQELYTNIKRSHNLYKHWEISRCFEFSE